VAGAPSEPPDPNVVDWDNVDAPYQACSPRLYFKEFCDAVFAARNANNYEPGIAIVRRVRKRHGDEAANHFVDAVEHPVQQLSPKRDVLPGELLFQASASRC